MNRIIIIGGMGPQASLELHRRIIDRATENGATDGKDFPYIVHLSLPIDDFIANRRSATRALRKITEAINQLNVIASDSVIIACNTAHLLKNDIERQTGITITSLVASAAEEIVERHITKVKLLATPTSILSNLYGAPLQELGVGVELPSKEELHQIELSIRSVIAGRPEMATITRTQHSPLLLGCTELSILYRGHKGAIDPLDCIVDKILPLRYNRRQL